jgi:hypothetical protein
MWISLLIFGVTKESIVMKNLKSGQYVIFCNKTYLFLGYSDYLKKRCVIADTYGNKIPVWSDEVK